MVKMLEPGEDTSKVLLYLIIDDYIYSFGQLMKKTLEADTNKKANLQSQVLFVWFCQAGLS